MPCLARAHVARVPWEMGLWHACSSWSSSVCAERAFTNSSPAWTAKLTVGFPAVVFQQVVFSVACNDAALSLPHPYTYEGQLVGIVGGITKSMAQRYVVQSICSRAIGERDLGYSGLENWCGLSCLLRVSWVVPK